MINVGSYYFLKGTNIEVGVRNVSRDPAHPYALCAFRHGRKTARTPARKMILQKVPLQCLTQEHAFDKRAQLKKSFVPCDPVSQEISSTNADATDTTLYVWGLQTLALSKKDFNTETGVMTFKTTPTRKAHVSVLRTHCTMPHLKGHTHTWDWSLESLANDPTPVEHGYIVGTTIPVSCFIQSEISLFKITKDLSAWIPNTHVTTQLDNLGSVARLTQGSPAYVHGLPIEFTAYGGDENITVGIGREYWKVKAEFVFSKPSHEHAYLMFHRQDDLIMYMKDYRRRKIKKILAIAVQ
jgi:hypothetical protein